MYPTKQGDWVKAGIASTAQQKLGLPVLSKQDCIAKFGNINVLESHICAGGELGKDSCKVTRITESCRNLIWCRATLAGRCTWQRWSRRVLRRAR